MLSGLLIRRFVQLPRGFFVRSQATEKALNIEKLDQDSALADLEADEELRIKEEQLQRSRNKSRLNPAHQNIVNNKPPYEEPKHWSHGTLKYQRKTYGKYGNLSNFNPALCWNKEELAHRQEYEAVAYPYTVPQLIEMARVKRQAQNDRVEQRHAEIVKRMEKLQTWKDELYKKIAKKEGEALAAKERKERLIEDVRRHFGYTVDPRDERFKEMLEKKEKEQKKAMKEERKKVKAEGMMAKLTAKGQEATAKRTKKSATPTENKMADDEEDK